MKIRILFGTCMAALALPAIAAEDITVQMYSVDEKGNGDSVGTIVISNAAHGVEFTPSLMGLPAGEHGFHLHENSSCEPAMKDGKVTAAAAAGEHHDPANTDKHGSPTLEGHLGDLPVLTVDAKGMSHATLLAPRLAFEDLGQGALVIHAGGDNYSDTPLPAGGGGARIACGVVNGTGQ